MRESKNGRLLALAGTLVLLAACGDKPTAPMSEYETASGATANAMPVAVVVMMDSVTPRTATVPSGGTQQYTAWSLNLPMLPADVTWSVSGGGAIATNGLFTAGASAGTFTVTATGANNALTASVTVTTGGGNGNGSGSCKPGDERDKKDCDKDRSGKDAKDKDRKDGKDKDKDHKNEHKDRDG